MNRKEEELKELPAMEKVFVVLALNVFISFVPFIILVGFGIKEIP